MPSSTPVSTLTELEQEITAYWVEVATAFGFPRSSGEIFGVLFVSPTPLTADDIVAHLGMSRSGVGQGLKSLLEMGAIRPASVVATRKDHFEPQTDLGVLVRRFLSSRVLPQLDEFSRRRAALGETARKQASVHLTARFDKLDRWSGKTKPLLSILKALAKE